VNPSSSRTHFDVLGIARAFHLDEKALEARYLELSRRWHPDRFAKAQPRERMEALSRTTEVNDAYKVLKDKRKRAEYLLRIEGMDIADERSSQVKADATLLMEIMELNEQLAEARARKDDAAVARLAAGVREANDEVWRRATDGFSAYEKGDRAVLPQLAQALILNRYHARFLEQVEAYEEERG
jgi:molecular chaperone HscB